MFVWGLVEVSATQKISAGAAYQLAAAVLKTRRAGGAIDLVVLRVDGALHLYGWLLDGLALRWLEGHSVSLAHFAEFSTGAKRPGSIESCTVQSSG